MICFIQSARDQICYISFNFLCLVICRSNIRGCLILFFNLINTKEQSMMYLGIIKMNRIDIRNICFAEIIFWFFCEFSDFLPHLWCSRCRFVSTCPSTKIRQPSSLFPAPSLPSWSFSFFLFDESLTGFWSLQQPECVKPLKHVDCLRRTTEQHTQSMQIKRKL